MQERIQEKTEEIIEIKGNQELMKKVAELYCAVFRVLPWEEDSRPEKVLRDMEEQFARPKAVTLACIENGAPIGFAWGYEIFLSDLKEDTRYPLELNFLFTEGKRVFYFQEIGVKTEFQRQGIGERLARELLKRVKLNDINSVILSTHHKAKPMISMISKIGFQDSKIIRPPARLGRTYWIQDFKPSKP